MSKVIPHVLTAEAGGGLTARYHKPDSVRFPLNVDVVDGEYSRPNGGIQSMTVSHDEYPILFIIVI